MKLIWVPISGQSDEEEEEEVLSSDTEDQNTSLAEAEIEETSKEEPVSFSQPLDIVEIKEKEPQIKNFQAARNLIEQQLRRKSDPGPPALITSVMPFPQTPINAQMLEVPEESIYDISLEVVTPPRPQKLADTWTGKESPPAIPPRMPLDNRCPPQIILPPPLARPASPLMPPKKRSPPASPRLQRTPPPPPPAKTYENGRRFSNYSLKSIGT